MIKTHESNPIFVRITQVSDKQKVESTGSEMFGVEYVVVNEQGQVVGKSKVRTFFSTNSKMFGQRWDVSPEQAAEWKTNKAVLDAQWESLTYDGVEILIGERKQKLTHSEGARLFSEDLGGFLRSVHGAEIAGKILDQMDAPEEVEAPAVFEKEQAS